MEEYKYDKESVDALVEWAKNTSYPEQLTLNDAESIFNMAKFVQSNLNDIAAHYPDEFYHPAITRLYQLKEMMEKNKDEGMSK